MAKPLSRRGAKLLKKGGPKVDERRQLIVKREVSDDGVHWRPFSRATDVGRHKPRYERTEFGEPWEKD